MRSHWCLRLRLPDHPPTPARSRLEHLRNTRELLARFPRLGASSPLLGVDAGPALFETTRASLAANTGATPRFLKTAFGFRSSPCASSSMSAPIVSSASIKLSPMMPFGPRLSHPATYKPGTRRFPAPVTRPNAFGTIPRVASKGTRCVSVRSPSRTEVSSSGFALYPTERSASATSRIVVSVAPVPARSARSGRTGELVHLQHDRPEARSVVVARDQRFR